MIRQKTLISGAGYGIGEKLQKNLPKKNMIFFC